MMRYFDEDDAKELNAEPWQLALLSANPAYCSWGPFEDYMINKGEGWNSSLHHNSWAEFGPFALDDLNECVNFYFTVNREAKDCETCGGEGYHPDAHVVVNTFYAHQCSSVGMPRSAAWNENITQDEVQALVDASRLIDFTKTFVPGEGWKPNDPPTIPTAAEVNASQHGMRSHDAINRCILIEARLKRLGLPKDCPTCEGHGYVHTAPAAHVSLILWWLHPRKGCSRGIEVKNIQQSDLPAIRDFLAEAAARNAARFVKLDLIHAN